jgi:hypothetical protein
MKPQQRFAVLVKSQGVLVMATCLITLPPETEKLREFSDAEGFFYMILGSVGNSIVMFACGLWLFRSNWLVGMVYPPSIVRDDLAHQNIIEGIGTLELFSALLKLLGIWYILQGISAILSGMNYFHEFQSFARFALYFETIAIVVVPLATGAMLLISTYWFIKIGFPELVAKQGSQNDEHPIQRSPSESLFVLIVKALGVWCFVNGLIRLPHAISQMTAGGIPNLDIFIKMIVPIFGLPVMSVIVGCTLFFATDLFTEWAFVKPEATIEEVLNDKSSSEACNS